MIMVVLMGMRMRLFVFMYVCVCVCLGRYWYADEGGIGIGRAQWKIGLY